MSPGCRCRPNIARVLQSQAHTSQTFPTPKVRKPASLKRWGSDVNVGKVPGWPLTQFNRCPLRGSTGMGDGHGSKLWTESKSVHVLLAYVQAAQVGVAPVHEVQQPPTPPLCCGSASVQEESTLPTSCTPSRKVLSQRASRKLLKKFHTPGYMHTRNEGDS